MPQLPHITVQGVLLGLAAVVVGWVLGRVARAVVEPLLAWRGRSPSSAAVFARLTGWLLLAAGVGAGLTITFPSVRPVDILGGVGVVSIAAGIAFQTVLGNMFAGLVLVSRDMFHVGDQIAVGDHRGTITRIDLSSSTLRTFDGQLVVVPNSVLHSQVVTVQTGYEHIRTTVSIDLDDRADLARARQVAIDTMSALPSVLTDPAPDALLSEVGSGTVRLDLRFWSGALQLETRHALHDVIAAVLAAFREHDVPTGSEVVVVEPGPHARTLLDRTPPRDGRR